MITYDKKETIYATLLGSYLFFIPLDFLTGRILSGTSASAILSILILALFAVKIFLNKEIYLPNDFMIIYLIVIIGSYFILFNTNFEPVRILQLGYYLTSSLAVVNIYRWEITDYKKINKWVIAGVLILSLYLLVFGEMAYGGTRLAPTQRDLNPNVGGGHAMIGFGIILFSLHRKINFIKISIAFVVLVAFFLLQSRTAFLAIGVALFITALIWVSKQSSQVTLTIKKISIVVFLLSALVLLFQGLGLIEFNLFETVNASGLNPFARRGHSGTITAGRVDIWINSIEQMNILVGRGLMNFRFYNNVAPHNLFLSTLFEAGIIGAILLFYFFYLLLKKSKILLSPNDKTSFYEYISIVCMLFIFGFGNDIMEYKFFWTGYMLAHFLIIDKYEYRDSIKFKIGNFVIHS